MTPSKLAVFLIAAPLFAQYTYSILPSDPLTSVNSSNWSPANGVVTTGSSGFTSADSNGGSLIWKNTGATQSEVKTTLTLTQSGGNYITYLYASSTALSGPTPAGQYYAVELQNPTFSGNSCSATLTLYKRVNNAISTLGTVGVWCHNGMVLRVVAASQSQIGAYIDNIFVLWAQDSSITTGEPGVGVRGAPASNTISPVSIGPLDTVAPGAVNAQSVGTSLFSTRVDMQWQGVVDNTNGVGLALYQIYKGTSVQGEVWLGNLNWTPTFSVQPLPLAPPSTTASRRWIFT